MDIDKFKGIEKDGVVYLTRTQVKNLTGLSYITVDRKTKRYGIKMHKQPMGGAWYVRQEIIDAIEKGWFTKNVRC